MLRLIFKKFIDVHKLKIRIQEPKKVLILEKLADLLWQDQAQSEARTRIVLFELFLMGSCSS